MSHVQKYSVIWFLFIWLSGFGLIGLSHYLLYRSINASKKSAMSKIYTEPCPLSLVLLLVNITTFQIWNLKSVIFEIEILYLTFDCAFRSKLKIHHYIKSDIMSIPDKNWQPPFVKLETTWEFYLLFEVKFFTFFKMYKSHGKTKKIVSCFLLGELFNC